MAVEPGGAEAVSWTLSFSTLGISAAVGFAATLAVSACAGPSPCGDAEWKSGKFSISGASGDGVPVLAGGTLELDMTNRTAKIVYPDGASSVSFAIVY